MRPRLIDFIGPAILALVLVSLVVILVVTSIPTPEA